MTPGPSPARESEHVTELQELRRMLQEQQALIGQLIAQQNAAAIRVPQTDPIMPVQTSPLGTQQAVGSPFGAFLPQGAQAAQYLQRMQFMASPSMMAPHEASIRAPLFSSPGGGQNGSNRDDSPASTVTLPAGGLQGPQMPQFPQQGAGGGVEDSRRRIQEDKRNMPKLDVLPKLPSSISS